MKGSRCLLKSENIHFSSLFPECCGFLQGAVWPDSSGQHEAVYPDRVYLADEQWAVPEGNRGPERDLPHHGSSRSCPWTAAESTQCLRHGKPTLSSDANFVSAFKNILHITQESFTWLLNMLGKKKTQSSCQAAAIYCVISHVLLSPASTPARILHFSPLDIVRVLKEIGWLSVITHHPPSCSASFLTSFVAGRKPVKWVEDWGKRRHCS